VAAEMILPASLATTTVQRFNGESSTSLSAALGVTVEAVAGASMAVAAFEPPSPPPSTLSPSLTPSLAASPQISPSASPSVSPSALPTATPSPPFQTGGATTEYPPAPPVKGAEGSRQEGGSADNDSTGAIVGGTIGGIFGGLLLIALILYLVLRRRRGKEEQMLVREADITGSEAVARSHSKRLDAYAASLDRATDTRLNPDHHPPAPSIDRATDQRLDPDHHRPVQSAPDSMELGRNESALTRL